MRLSFTIKRNKLNGSTQWTESVDSAPKLSKTVLSIGKVIKFFRDDKVIIFIVYLASKEYWSILFRSAWPHESENLWKTFSFFFRIMHLYTPQKFWWPRVSRVSRYRNISSPDIFLRFCQSDFCLFPKPFKCFFEMVAVHVVIWPKSNSSSVFKKMFATRLEGLLVSFRNY